MRTPKGFISIGKDTTLNIDCVNVEKSFIDKKRKIAVIYDKYNYKYVIDEKLVKGKLWQTN